MVKLTHGSCQQRSFLTLTALASLLIAGGCQFEVQSDDPPQAPDGPHPDVELPDDNSTCAPDTVVRNAFVCAGYVSEQRHVSQRLVRLQPVTAAYACHTSGTGLTPYLEGDDPGDYPGNGYGGGTGGSYMGTGGIASTGGYAMGGESGDGDGDWPGDEDGDWKMGGAPGAGGSYPATGGVSGIPEATGWCGEAPGGTAISGVTYSVDACGATELRLPLRIQEPNSWYRIRVFHGASPCERGDVIADISGQGTGEVIDLPIVQPSEGYVSIEYTVDSDDYYYYDDYGYPYPDYYGSGILEVELNPIAGGLIDGQ